MERNFQVFDVCHLFSADITGALTQAEEVRFRSLYFNEEDVLTVLFKVNGRFNADGAGADDSNFFADRRFAQVRVRSPVDMRLVNTGNIGNDGFCTDGYNNGVIGFLL